MDRPTTERPGPLLIVAALRDELKPVRRAIALFEALWACPDVRFLQTGMGAERAIQVIRKEISDGSAPPGDVLHVGFAGALSTDLAIGDIVEPGTVLSETGDAIELPSPWDREPPTTLLTCTNPALTPEAKAKLAETGADAIDMESYPAAEWLMARGWRYHAIRAITDGPNDSIPAAAMKLVDERGNPRAGKAAMHLLRHPGDAPALMRLGQSAKIAGAALANATLARLQWEGWW